MCYEILSFLVGLCINYYCDKLLQCLDHQLLNIVQHLKRLLLFTNSSIPVFHSILIQTSSHTNKGTTLHAVRMFESTKHNLDFNHQFTNQPGISQPVLPLMLQQCGMSLLMKFRHPPLLRLSGES